VVEAVAAVVVVVGDAADAVLEILALAELAFAAAAVEHLLEDTQYAVAGVGVDFDVGLHNWYKLDFDYDGVGYPVDN